MTSQTLPNLWVYGDVCRLFMRGLETLLPLKRKNMHRMLTEFIVINPEGVSLEVLETLMTRTASSVSNLFPHYCMQVCASRPCTNKALYFS